MAYLKFSRDKRGYEHFYLVQPSNRGKARPRVLYWFRTPPGVKVGRLPFDPDMRRALEAQNPDVIFDWEAIANTPIPPPVEPERWRERRRIERVFRETEEAASIPDAGEQPARSEMPAIEPVLVEPSVFEIDDLPAMAEPVALEGLPSGPPADAGQPESSGQAREYRQDQQGRRRRRRRGRRKPQVQGSGFTVQGSQVPGSPVPAGEPDKSTSEEPFIQDSGDPGENHEP